VTSSVTTTVAATFSGGKKQALAVLLISGLMDNSESNITPIITNYMV